MEKRWRRSLELFTEEHHEKRQETNNSARRVLLIVNPAAGRGKAMKSFQSCLKAFRQREDAVEVYVTKGREDVRSLAETKDLTKYTYLAFLSGDSTISEAIQGPLRKHGGKWPYTPILHLPGGSSNVIANEFFPSGASPRSIITQHATVKQGSVLKATASNNGETIFALQMFGAGMIKGMVETIESRDQTGIYSALTGKTGLIPIIASCLFQMSTRYKDPAVLTVWNSQHEADGKNMQLGLTRLDHTLAVVQVSQFNSGLTGLSFFVSMLSGRLAKEWKQDKLRDGVDIQLHTSTEPYVYNAPLDLVADGTTAITLCADSFTFRVIPDAIPFCTP